MSGIYGFDIDTEGDGLFKPKESASGQEGSSTMKGASSSKSHLNQTNTKLPSTKTHIKPVAAVDNLPPGLTKKERKLLRQAERLKASKAALFSGEEAIASSQNPEPKAKIKPGPKGKKQKSPHPAPSQGPPNIIKKPAKGKQAPAGKKLNNLPPHLAQEAPGASSIPAKAGPKGKKAKNLPGNSLANGDGEQPNIVKGKPGSKARKEFVDKAKREAILEKRRIKRQRRVQAKRERKMMAQEEGFISLNVPLGDNEKLMQLENTDIPSFISAHEQARSEATSESTFGNRSDSIFPKFTANGLPIKYRPDSDESDEWDSESDELESEKGKSQRINFASSSDEDGSQSAVDGDDSHTIGANRLSYDPVVVTVRKWDTGPQAGSQGTEGERESDDIAQGESLTQSESESQASEREAPISSSEKIRASATVQDDDPKNDKDTASVNPSLSTQSHSQKSIVPLHISGGEPLLFEDITDNETDRRSGSEAPEGIEPSSSYSVTGNGKRIRGKFDSSERKRRRMERFSTQSDSYSSPPPPVVSSEKGDPIVGYSQALEKSFYRLTSEPNPANVRSEEVLRRCLPYVLRKFYAENLSYIYINDQLKAIRQDLTVQHIKNEFTLQVYHSHARIAIENSDLGEFNQCLSQVFNLYESEGDLFETSEFVVYNVLYMILTGNDSGVSKFRLKLLESMPSKSESEYSARFSRWIKPALDVATSIVSGDYYNFFKLYRSFRAAEGIHLAVHLLKTHVVPKQRFVSLLMMCKGFKRLPLNFLEGQLALDADGHSVLEFLKAFKLDSCVTGNDLDCTTAKPAVEALLQSGEYKKVDLDAKS